MSYTHYGTVIVGYQGIGKSTLAFHNPRVIDLESSNFFINGKRADDWYIPYCNIARSLCRQGYIVCVSSHKEVRNELLKNPALAQIVVYPSLILKDKWIDKLRYRYEETRSEKDFKAYQNALYCYDENIAELMKQEGFMQVQISDMGYDLVEMLKLRTR